MPPIDRSELYSTGALWTGACPARQCGVRFEIEADPWQNKISVLSGLRDLRSGLPDRHAHGRFLVLDHFERGGE